MPSEGGFLVSNFTNERAVHRKSVDGRPSSRAQSDQDDIVPAEVIAPDVTTRVEERNELPRIGIRYVLARTLSE
jgi:hypothetical protein